MNDKQLPSYVQTRTRPGIHLMVDMSKTPVEVPVNPDHAYMFDKAGIDKILDKDAQIEAVHKILMLRYSDSNFKKQMLLRAAERILEIYPIKILLKLEKQDIKYGFSGLFTFDGFAWLANACEQVQRDYFDTEEQRKNGESTFVNNMQRLLGSVKKPKKQFIPQEKD